MGMQTQTDWQTPEQFDLPPLLSAMYLRLSGQKDAKENELLKELEMVGRRMGRTVRLAGAVSRPLSVEEVRQLLIASTGPSSDGRCGACGRDLSR